MLATGIFFRNRTFIKMTAERRHENGSVPFGSETHQTALPYLNCFSKGFVMVDRIAVGLDGDLLFDACFHNTVSLGFVLK